jgi:hypothetical protein
MPRRPKGSVPSLQHHKPSGRARVTINGRDIWLGKWGSPESRLAYDRIIAEYLVSGRVRDQPAAPPEAPAVVTVDPGTPGVNMAAGLKVTADSEDRISSDPTVAEVQTLQTPERAPMPSASPTLQIVIALRRVRLNRPKGAWAVTRSGETGRVMPPRAGR